MAFMFSWYPVTFLLTSARTKKKEGKILSMKLKMGFLAVIYTGQLAVVAFSVALRVHLRPSLT